MAKKHTKKALFTSIISLILCCAMLVGTTFAWFTDSVTSGLNNIVSGNLDVELIRNGSVKVDENVQLFNTVALWEPGMVAYENLSVKNAGNLALKYTLSINYANQNELNGHKLSDVLQVAVVDQDVTGMTREDVLKLAQASNNKGSLATFSMQGELVEGGATTPKNFVIFWEPGADDNNYNANNGAETSDRKPLQISFGVNVYATQLPHEVDSFGPDYDANTAVKVTTPGELIAALANGGSVSLESDITVVDDSIVIPAGVSAALNLNGHTISGAVPKSEGHVIVNEGTLSVMNGTVKSTHGNGGSAIMNKGTLEVNNVTLNGASAADGGYPSYTVNNIGVMTINDSNITSVHGAVASYGEGAVVTLNNTNIDMTGILGKTSHGIYTYNNGKVVVNGGNIANKATDQAASGASVINGAVTVNSGSFSGRIENSYGTPVIKGGVFSADPSKYVASGYKATYNEGTWTVGIDTEKVEDVFEKAENGDTINLAAGINVIPDSAQGKTLTIKGSETGETIIATQDDGSYEGCDYSLNGATVTFQNITINTDSHTYTGYAGLNATYKNCTINGAYTLYGDSVFENCTFNVSGDAYNIWTWGAPTATFIDCTFNTSGKSVLLYGGVDTVLTVTNCIFNDANDYADVNNKAAIEVGSDWSTDKKQIIATNCTVNGFDITDKGIYTGSTLWGNKNSLDETRLSVKIDGVDARKTVYIRDRDELVKFANDVNNNGKNFSGKTVVLTNDIDLAGIDWEPIGQTVDKTAFLGTFDGQNHTIYNLTVDSSDDTRGNYSSGLFGWVEGKQTIKNVKIDGAKISGHHYVSALVGYTYSAQISNCHVINSQITCTHANDAACGDKCGLIAGYAGNESIITDCSASNSTVTAGRDAGQLIGTGYNKSVKDCSAANVTVNAGGDCTGANINAAIIGRVMG